MLHFPSRSLLPVAEILELERHQDMETLARKLATGLTEPKKPPTMVEFALKTKDDSWQGEAFLFLLQVNGELPQIP